MVVIEEEEQVLDGDGVARDGDADGTDVVNTTQILQRPDETPLENENSQAQDSVDRTGWYRPEPSRNGDLDRKRFSMKCVADSWRVCKYVRGIAWCFSILGMSQFGKLIWVDKILTLKGQHNTFGSYTLKVDLTGTQDRARCTTMTACTTHLTTTEGKTMKIRGQTTKTGGQTMKSEGQTTTSRTILTERTRRGVQVFTTEGPKMETVAIGKNTRDPTII